MSIQNKIFNLQSLITNQKEISPGYFRLSFFAPEIAKTAQPGQFVHFYCGEGTYLRRPFSIAGVKKNQVEIIYKVVGKGTELLSRKKRGKILDALGPLGNGFTYSLLATPASLRVAGRARYSSILLAGGTGVASLLFLAQHLSPYQLVNLSTVVFIGAKTKNDLLCVSDFKKLGCQVKLATEDGSLGFQGLVTDLFRNSLITHHSSLITVVYACGPYPMLKEVAKITQKYKIPCQVSLENIMACGLGACRGCVIKVSAKGRFALGEKSVKCKVKSEENKPYTLHLTPYTYKTVCKDGPVFAADEIIWE